MTKASERTIGRAIKILKTTGAKGSFKAYVSETNKNEVEIFGESGLYCIINVRSGRIKDR